MHRYKFVWYFWQCNPGIYSRIHARLRGASILVSADFSFEVFNLRGRGWLEPSDNQMQVADKQTTLTLLLIQRALFSFLYVFIAHFVDVFAVNK
jgi:hypothetical protein